MEELKEGQCDWGWGAGCTIGRPMKEARGEGGLVDQHLVPRKLGLFGV